MFECQTTVPDEGFRTDLADALVRTATEGLHIGQSVNMVTAEEVPTYPRTFLREGPSHPEVPNAPTRD
ncbi:hypothetical protein GCM10029964_071130 [Kibdelosporangium lantanae]